ncbi:YeeE/YedE family protein [Chitinophaga filiformis]|uniref:DUF6691 family protein n=1 Tax=Chitinophaga filiformis TaxID=104663 RepID=UPI001F3FEBA4|nr:DUF6691 family protein [Chitinophaga filiformis]MCF6406312.1 YeeE/YedE family protein [Chitinophaga filiformis]
MSLPSNTDFELESPDTPSGTISTTKKAPWWRQLQYLAAGALFGIILIKSEVISWFRIQEMFRLQSFHMYGVIGSAVITGIISVAIIKKTGVKTFYGEPITFRPKPFHKGQIFGGLLFGFGWALTGACPGPLFAQIGAGFTVSLATLASAILGTWVYGMLRDKLPH